MNKTVLVSGMMVMGAFLGGCAGKAQMDQQQGAAPPSISGEKIAGTENSGAVEQVLSETPVTSPDAGQESKMVTVYFEFDSYVLSEDSKKALTNNASWLRSHPEVKITIEGHADERGSDEYNMALGEKRAQVAREYIENLGISGDRLKTISYGEEKPSAEGDDDTAWSKNRRAEFL